MVPSNDLSEKAEELQALEHALQNSMMQRQTIQVERNELETALKEVKSAKEGDAYKIISGVMLRADTKQLAAELEEKAKLLDLRLSSIAKQELLVESKISNIKKELSSAQKKN